MGLAQPSPTTIPHWPERSFRTRLLAKHSLLDFDGFRSSLTLTVHPHSSRLLNILRLASHHPAFWSHHPSLLFLRQPRSLHLQNARFFDCYNLLLQTRRRQSPNLRFVRCHLLFFFSPRPRGSHFGPANNRGHPTTSGRTPCHVHHQTVCTPRWSRRGPSPRLNNNLETNCNIHERLESFGCIIRRLLPVHLLLIRPTTRSQR